MDAAIESALDAGFRHFDTAEAYENEEFLGKSLNAGLKSRNIEREDIFITTKIAEWRMDHDNALESIEASLKNL